MEPEAINNLVRASVQTSRPRPSNEGNSSPSPAPEFGAEDIVVISSEGRLASEELTSVETSAAKDPTPSQVQQKSNHQRQFDLTDNNVLVLKVVDTTTREVLRQFPPEAELRLKHAIQNGIENFQSSDLPEA